MCRHSHVRFGVHLFHLEPVSRRSERPESCVHARGSAMEEYFEEIAIAEEEIEERVEEEEVAVREDRTLCGKDKTRSSFTTMKSSSSGFGSQNAQLPTS